MERECLIWSEEHGAWWNPRSAGYTTSIAKAGRYSPERAASIVESANAGGTFCEIAIPIPSGFDEISKLPSGGR